MIKQKNILIVGGGWLGLELAKRLSISNYVVVTTSFEEKGRAFEELGFEALIVDRSFENEALPHVDVAVVCLPPGRKPSANLTFDAHLHENVVSALQRAGCLRVIYTSSTSVYTSADFDLQEMQANSETTQFSLETIYKKIEDVTILRLGGLMGPDRHPGRFLAGKTELPSPAAGVNFIHRNDVIRGIEFVIKQNLWSECFNLVMPQHPCRSVFFSMAAEAIGLVSPTFDLTDLSLGKTISSKKILDKGFEFEMSDPLNALTHC